MKIPNAIHAIVPREKLIDYLLSTSHRDGQHKAKFFSQFGLSQDNWQDFEGLVRQHALEYEISKEEPSPFGTRYVLEGIIEMPDGRSPEVRTVWFIRSEEDFPRFVTAYPIKSYSD